MAARIQNRCFRAFFLWHLGNTLVTIYLVHDLDLQKMGSFFYKIFLLNLPSVYLSWLLSVHLPGLSFRTLNWKATCAVHGAWKEVWGRLFVFSAFKVHEGKRVLVLLLEKVATNELDAQKELSQPVLRPTVGVWFIPFCWRCRFSCSSCSISLPWIH